MIFNEYIKIIILFGGIHVGLHEIRGGGCGGWGEEGTHHGWNWVLGCTAGGFQIDQIGPMTSFVLLKMEEFLTHLSKILKI